jgi:hypothetical protein
VDRFTDSEADLIDDVLVFTHDRQDTIDRVANQYGCDPSRGEFLVRGAVDRLVQAGIDRDRIVDEVDTPAFLVRAVE